MLLIHGAYIRVEAKKGEVTLRISISQRESEGIGVDSLVESHSVSQIRPQPTLWVYADWSAVFGIGATSRVRDAHAQAWVSMFCVWGWIG